MIFMQNTALTKQGFTLIETMVTMAIFILISLALGIFYVDYYQVFHTQQALVSVAGSASATANELQNAALQANQILVSHTFSGTAYNTGQNTLVLELPSIDGSGNIVSGKYDYMVFYATSTHLYKLVQADAQSTRPSGLRQLSDTVSTFTFTYNNIDLTQADKIDVDMQMQVVANRQTIPYYLHQAIYLRNR